MAVDPDERVLTVRPPGLGRWHANRRVEVVDARRLTRELILRRWARPGWDREDADFDALPRAIAAV